MNLAVQVNLGWWLKASRPHGVNELRFGRVYALFWWWCPRTT
jgi:hypothetical protein